MWGMAGSGSGRGRRTFEEDVDLAVEDGALGEELGLHGEGLRAAGGPIPGLIRMGIRGGGAGRMSAADRAGPRVRGGYEVASEHAGWTNRGWPNPIDDFQNPPSQIWGAARVPGPATKAT